MGFLKMIWGEGRPTETVSREEFERVTQEYDSKIEALDNMIHALRDHEPDERTQPHAP